MLRIRLRRVGKKKQPMYRIVVADSRAPRDGPIVESIGYYHPLNNPSTIVLDGERVRLWLDRGAQPSDRVAKILAIEGIAELSPKLKTRIALGEQRAKEAAKAKPQAEAPTEEAPAAEAKAPTEEAPTAEAEPEEAPTEAAAEEAPAAKVTAEEKPAEPEAGGEQPADAEAEATPEEPEAGGEPSEEAQAAAGEEEKPEA